MMASHVFDGDRVSLSTVVRDNYVLTSGTGAEVYALTEKETGRMTLAAFDSKAAANRFFLENTVYHAQKIL